jgi:hypothetical protein
MPSLSSYRWFLRDLVFDDLPPIPAIDSDDFERAFLAKLAQCSTRCHFWHEDTDRDARRIKSRDLADILHLLDVPADFRKLPPPLLHALLSMARANVDRALPLIDAQYLVTDDLQPFVDPEWEHLGLVYQIVRRFQEVHPRCPEFDDRFVKMLVRQIGSRDEREHAALLQIVLHCCVVSRTLVAPVLSALATEIAVWESSPNYMFAVTAVLLIVTGLLRECPVAVKAAGPLISRCLQLITDRNFLFFKNAFYGMAVVLLNVDAGYAAAMVAPAIRFWPHAATVKQAVFFRIFLMAIPRLHTKAANALLPKLFPILASSIASPCARVCEGAIAFVMDRSLEGFIAANARTVIPAIYPALLEASVQHWSAEVRDDAEKAAAKLGKWDPRISGEVSDNGAGEARAESRTMQKWVQVAEAASRNGHHLGRKLREIAFTFGGAARMPETAPVKNPRPTQAVRGHLPPLPRRATGSPP